MGFETVTLSVLEAFMDDRVLQLNERHGCWSGILCCINCACISVSDI